MISDVLGKAIEKVMPIIEFLYEAITFLLNALKDLINYLVTDFADDWHSTWSSIVDWFKNIFNSILKVVEDVVNGVINCVNKIIDGINGVSGVVGIELEKWDNVDFTPDDSGMGGSGGGGHRGDGSPGYAFGTDYIPEDDYPAKLHRGEAVLSAADAEAFRKLGGKGSLERIASAPADSGASGQLAEVLGKLAENSGTTNNITQNNYSPKELSPYDTKRYMQQIAQQLSERK